MTLEEIIGEATMGANINSLEKDVADAVRGWYEEQGYVQLCKKGTCSACDPVRKIKENIKP